MGSKMSMTHSLHHSRHNYGSRHMLDSLLDHSLCDGRVLVLCILPYRKLYLVLPQSSSTRSSPPQTKVGKVDEFPKLNRRRPAIGGMTLTHISEAGRFRLKRTLLLFRHEEGERSASRTGALLGPVHAHI